MKVLLFTDTLADINGVARFISDAAQQALRTRRDLRVFTSTPFRAPDLDNVRNFAPAASITMPAYPQLKLVAPPALAMLRAAAEVRPDVVHVSTPGPVGTVGRWFARRNGIPLAGVYHTDFPEYVQRILGKESLTDACTATMSWFYGPFSVVFSRSEEYAAAMRGLGVANERIERLKPGIDLTKFGVNRRDPGIWKRLGCRDADVRVLYVGRVSVEKGLPIVTRVWAEARAALAARGVNAALAVVGDGPYRGPMERALEGAGADFLGFRHGEELATLYASADLFAFPSATDTLGQVVLESQTSGVPVLVTDEGGPSGVVDNGRTGLVLPAKDERAWLRAIVELGSSPERLREMGRLAAAWAEQYGFAASFDHFWKTHERIAPAYHRA
ncbi:MAG: glycosyltransferase family 4 protein [Phycisphaerales bacterium]